MLIDSHAHLDDSSFKNDIEEIIKRAKEARIKAIISNGTGPNSNRKVLELSKKYPIIKASLGLYPSYHLGKTEEKKKLKEEIEFIKEHKNEIIAIGEIGLDNKFCDNKEEQEKQFIAMIKLAKELEKPIIVHSRKAEERVIEILEKENPKKIIMHCFSGKKKFIKRIKENKWTFTIPTNIVRSNHFQELVKEVPLSQLLTETDAPYLSPFPNQRNEPSNIPKAIEKIAEIKGMDIKEVELNLFMNYQRIFL